MPIFPELAVLARSVRAGRGFPGACRLGLDREFADRRGKHYLQVTDDHFERTVVQNPAQQGAATDRTEMHAEKASIGKSETCKDLRDDADVCKLLEKRAMGVTGLEPVTSSV